MNYVPPVTPATSTDYEQQQQQEPTALAGVYSSTGFDMINILVRLTQRFRNIASECHLYNPLMTICITPRTNPQIQLGPIDLSCSFVVSDANNFDQPVVYCSPAFERLTGYTNSEIVGKNCRFLQSPDGQVIGGTRRQHTDNEAVFYFKSQLNQGKEHQASIINYRKGGQPFVNLVTIVPLFDAFGKIEYYVGLQVDLVEQPNAILQKMQDGTYVMNYSQPMNLVEYPSLRDGSNNTSQNMHGLLDTYFQELPNGNNIVKSRSISIVPAEQQSIPDILSLLSSSTATNDSGSMLKEWNQLIFEQSSDFIHVLSLKGIFLYASDASLSLLEYQPSELLNQSLSTICHPSDIIPIMREIKESAASTEQNISLLFRMRRKYSGYIWMECFGKVHLDQSRSRKCLVLSGRQMPVYSLPKKQMTLDLQRKGTRETSKDFWAKLSLGGLYLYVTKGSEEVVGYSPSSLEQESIFQYIDNLEITDVRRALELIRYNDHQESMEQLKRMQQAIRVSHTLLTAKGDYVPVVSTFYPGDTFTNLEFGAGAAASFILLHVQLSEGVTPVTMCDSVGSVNSAKLQIFEYPTGTLMNDIAGHTNFFTELETTRGTSWQYELHQLQRVNDCLKNKIAKYEKAAAKVALNERKRKKTKSANDDGQLVTKRMCVHCQTTESPEWRRGPSGPKELCNACGLRYAKSKVLK